jgi:hypothetical protein
MARRAAEHDEVNYLNKEMASDYVEHKRSYFNKSTATAVHALPDIDKTERDMIDIVS